MGLSDISRKSFGFDIAEFPLGMEDGAETDVPEAPSPTKSKLPGSSHRRQRSSMSNVGVPSGNDQNILYLQSQPMRELEQLIIAFDALEEFANCYHQLAK